MTTDTTTAPADTNPTTTVTFVWREWSDEVQCTRCGGVTGRAIGD